GNFQRQVSLAALNQRRKSVCLRSPVPINRHPAGQTGQFPRFDSIGGDDIQTRFERLLSSFAPTEVGNSVAILRPSRPGMDKADSILTARAVVFPVPGQLTHPTFEWSQGKNIATSTDVD